MQEVIYLKDIKTIEFEQELNVFQAAVHAEIKRTHATGKPTSHADEKGVYLLYPDGKKVYKKKDK